MQAQLFTNQLDSGDSAAQDATGPCALHVEGNLNGATMSALISPDGVLTYVPYDFPFIGSEIFGNGVYLINLPGSYKVKLRFQRNSMSQSLVPSAVNATLFN